MVINTLIASLILAALSGLTFVAYKHPSGYKKISIPLSLTIVLMVILIISYSSTGILTLIVRLKENLDLFPDNTLKSELNLINRLYHYRNLFLYVLLVSAVTLGYLFFLYHLPKLLECKPDATNSTEKEDIHSTTDSNTSSD